MRTIKFRVWNKSIYKHLLESTIFSLENTGWININKETNGGIDEFTGLQDKNGKDIYEGDILEFEEDSNEFLGSDIKVRRKVGWQNYYGAGWHFGTSWKDGDKRWSFELPYDAVVIGNIHENKHLTQSNEN